MSADLPAALAGILTGSASWLRAGGYPLLAVAVLIEGVGIPAPGGLLMSGAALLAGRGDLSLGAVLLTAWSAATLGDNLGYLIGRHGGRRGLLRLGVRRRRLARLTRFVHRWGIALILLGRFIDGTRQLDGMIAGSARLPWPRFALADALGSALWVGFWVLGLYTLDRHGGAAHRALLWLNPSFHPTRVGVLCIAFLVGAVGTLSAVRLFHRRRRKRPVTSDPSIP